MINVCGWCNLGITQRARFFFNLNLHPTCMKAEVLDLFTSSFPCNSRSSALPVMSGCSSFYQVINLAQ